MKVLLYFESEKMLAKSGIGRALDHQKRALTEVGISYTLDEKKIMTSCTSIHTESIVIIWSIKPEEKEKLSIMRILQRKISEIPFIRSNQLSPIVKISGRIVPKADYLITPTPYSKQLLESYGIRVPIQAISNGIDLEKYHPDPMKEQKFREYFKLSPDQKVIICVGLFSNVKESLIS